MILSSLFPFFSTETSSYFKSEALHTALVRINRRLALLGGIGGIREEHAFVAFVFLVEAYTAGLYVTK